MKVLKLKKQDSSWKIVSEHTFYKSDYRIFEDGSFYRGIRKVVNKPDAKGDIFVQLTDDNNIKVRFKIHQIVAQTFLPNKLKDGCSVDHINRNRLDNSLLNLRIASRQTQYTNRENVEYKYKKVMCLTNNITYKSCRHAEISLRLTFNTVSRVARGDRKSIHGYEFKYVI
jgi:hypothetical protein